MRTAWTKAATTDGTRWRAATRRASIALLAAVLVTVGTAGPLGARTAAAQTASPLDGTASLSGTVTAAEPFAAARVYVRNVDRKPTFAIQRRSAPCCEIRHEYHSKRPPLPLRRLDPSRHFRYIPRENWEWDR